MVDKLTPTLFSRAEVQGWTQVSLLSGAWEGHTVPIPPRSFGEP